MTTFTKPSAEEVEEYAATSTTSNKAGITPYSVATQVNRWLAEEGLPQRVSSSRVYSQFVKRSEITEDMLVDGGPRLTPEGAQTLASIVFKHVANETPDESADAEELASNEQPSEDENEDNEPA